MLHNKYLVVAAQNTGVATAFDYAIFYDHGYRALICSLNRFYAYTDAVQVAAKHVGAYNGFRYTALA